MFKKLKVHFGLKSIIFIGVLLVLLAVDLITKHFEELQGWNFIFINKLIWVESGVRNPGASFSFLADVVWGQTFLKVLTIVLLLGLIAVFLFLPERFTLLKLSIAMIISGALGNLIDRFMFDEVRDFVWVNIFGNPACCNFADFWIVFGAIIAVIDMLFINEWAVFPLTKTAKQAQAKSKVEKQGELAKKTCQDTAEIDIAKAEDTESNDE